METIIYGAMIVWLLFLYWVFGRTAWRLLGAKTDVIMELLCGVMIYHILFQAAALPMILCKQPLSRLSLLWLMVLAAVLALWIYLEVKGRKTGKTGLCLPGISPWLAAAAALVMLLQTYRTTINDYLGWDTAAYVGTVATSVARNSMYLYDGQSGAPEEWLDFRYALSTFYIHSAVWCQILPVRALHYAKIVQGGVLTVLSDFTVFQLGRFLFAGRRYRDTLTPRQAGNAAAAMMMLAVVLHYFYRTIYTPSDFLLNRALEAKAYCCNYVLPFLLLLTLMLWRDSKNRETGVMLFAGALGSVAISMSSLMTVPAMLTVLFLPMFFCRRSFRIIRLYVMCMLPNVLYALVYLLYQKEILRIKV